MGRVRGRDVVDGGVGDGRARVPLNLLEDVPGVVGERGVAGETVEDEDGFDGFGSGGGVVGV